MECSYLTPTDRDEWDEKYRDYKGDIPVRQYKMVMPENRTAGEAWLNTAKKDIEANKWVPPQVTRVKEKAQRTSFKDYATNYVENRKKRNGDPIAVTTRDKYREYLSQLLDSFGGKPMNDITEKDIQAWYDFFPIRNDKQGVHGDSQRAHIYRDLLRPIFAKAASEPLDKEGDETLIRRSPCTIRVDRPALKHVKRIAEPDQLKRIYMAMPRWIALAIYLGGVMGLREGEILGLRRMDVDLEEDMLHVRHSVKPVKGPDGGRVLELGSPKTRASVRGLSIPDFLIPLIKDQLRNFAGDENDVMLFTSPKTGGLVSGQTLRNLFYKARDTATPELCGMSFHDLRDTALSHLAESGASIGTLKAQAGHTNILTVSKYQQPTESNRREAYKKLEARFDDTETIPAPQEESASATPASNVDATRMATILQTLPAEQRAETLSALPVAVRAQVILEMSRR